MQETQVQSLGQEVPLEKGMAIHSSILAGKIPWIEEPGRLYPLGSQIVRLDWVTFKFTAAKEALSCSLSTPLPFSEPHTPQQPELNSDPLVKPTKSERNGITILHTEQQCLFLKLEIEAPCLSYPKTKQQLFWRGREGGSWGSQLPNCHHPRPSLLLSHIQACPMFHSLFKTWSYFHKMHT